MNVHLQHQPNQKNFIHGVKSTRTKEEIKDKSPPAKQQTITEAIKPSKQLKISSTEYSEYNEENQLDTSSIPISAKLKGLHPWCTIARRQDDIKDESTKKTSPGEEPSPETQLTSNIEIRTKEKTEENETVTDQKELDEVKKNESFVHPQRSNIKYTKRSADDQLRSLFKRKILSITQDEEAYPWAKKVAKNRECQSPLSDKTQKMEGANNLLPSIMKSKLYEHISYPDKIEKKFNDKIKKEGNNYVCINCTSKPTFSAKQRNSVMRHVKAELGYQEFRCSFCDEKSNGPRIIVKHYASTHGIPTNWVKS